MRKLLCAATVAGATPTTAGVTQTQCPGGNGYYGYGPRVLRLVAFFWPSYSECGSSAPASPFRCGERATFVPLLYLAPSYAARSSKSPSRSHQ